MNSMIDWTPEKLAYLRNHFPYEPAQDVADVLGISFTTVRLKAIELGLKKADGYNKNQFHCRFVKGYKNGWYKNIGVDVKERVAV